MERIQRELTNEITLPLAVVAYKSNIHAEFCGCGGAGMPAALRQCLATARCRLSRFLPAERHLARVGGAFGSWQEAVTQ